MAEDFCKKTQKKVDGNTASVPFFGCRKNQSKPKQTKAKQTKMNTTPSSPTITVQLPTDPAYWGSTATEADVDRILTNLESMIRDQFPEFELEFQFERCATPRFGGVFSSDESVAESVYEFIRDNWTAAL